MRHSRVPYSLRVRDKDRYAKEERGEEGALLAREREKKTLSRATCASRQKATPRATWLRDYSLQRGIRVTSVLIFSQRVFQVAHLTDDTSQIR